MFNPLIYFIIIIASLVLALLLYICVKKHDIGNEKMYFLSKTIQAGAMAFLKKEYSFLAFIVLIISLLIYFCFHHRSLYVYSFIFGAILPAIAGYIGMKAATASNARTAQAAATKGEKSAFSLAIMGGAVMGFSTCSLALGGMFVISFFFPGLGFLPPYIFFAFGACFTGLFSRVGGGIYTKAADVGADLAGKIEASIPEDDPRNPAVIADNVGDNVGDIAGMGADIFASYICAFVATIALQHYLNVADVFSFPLLIGFMGLIGSLITYFFTPLFQKRGSAFALRIMPIFSSIITILLIAINLHFYPIELFLKIKLLLHHYMPHAAFFTVILGILGATFIGLVTEWYTSKKPVYQIAMASQAGHGSNVIRGLSVGMESTILPIIIICIVMYGSFFLLGFYGIGIAAVSMLCNIATTITIDAYGPISDNAGGIAEMAELDSSVRDVTDKLDALGNTTAAIGKGFAIGAAILTSIALIAAYMIAVSKHATTSMILSIADPFIMIGFFIGGILTFMFSSLTMKAVGETAISMVKEVRHQFKTIPGLIEGTADPDYKKCINIATSAALKKMLVPGLIAIIIPILCIFVFHFNSFRVIAGILAGILLTGSFMGIFMSTAGGAWDNAKKYLEKGKMPGHEKGSDTHKAAVTGDTVGDPFKDTSGPSLNILIKIICILGLLLIPFFI